MNALQKTIEKALWFFGVKVSRAPGRSWREGRANPSSPSSQSQAPSLNSSGSWTSSADLRALLEIDRYEQVPEALDTRVHQDRGWLRCLRGVEQWESMSKLEEPDVT